MRERKKWGKKGEIEREKVCVCERETEVGFQVDRDRGSQPDRDTQR